MAGEVNVEELVKKVIREIGYNEDNSPRFNENSVEILNLLLLISFMALSFIKIDQAPIVISTLPPIPSIVLVPSLETIGF